jgi:hypothetical protein
MKGIADMLRIVRMLIIRARVVIIFGAGSNWACAYFLAGLNGLAFHLFHLTNERRGAKRRTFAITQKLGEVEFGNGIASPVICSVIAEFIGFGK